MWNVEQDKAGAEDALRLEPEERSCGVSTGAAAYGAQARRVAR